MFLTLIWCLAISLPVYTMEQDKRLENCKVIDTYQKLKLSVFKTTVSPQNYNEQIQKIESKLNLIQEKINTDQQNLLNAFQKKYTIPQEIWLSWMNAIQSIKDFEQENRHLPLPGVTHDKTNPLTTRMIKNILRKNGINPKRITITRDHEAHKPRWKIAPILPKMINIANGNAVVNFDAIHPGFILLSPQIEDFPWSTQIAYYSALVQILKQLIITEPTMIKYFIPMFYNIPQETIKNSQEYYAIISNAIPYGTLNLALENHKKSKMMCDLHSFEIFNFPEFTSEDYIVLSKIKRLWKMLKWLKPYKNMVPQDSI